MLIASMALLTCANLAFGLSSVFLAHPRRPQPEPNYPFVCFIGVVGIIMC